MLLNLPKTLVVDVTSKSESLRMKNQSFKIPETLDLTCYMSPISPEKVAEYSAFGIIVNDPSLNGKRTLCLVKKRLRSIRKNQWYVFSDGQYYPITTKDALENYSPKMIFYKLNDQAHKNFMFKEDADLQSTFTPAVLAAEPPPSEMVTLDLKSLSTNYNKTNI